MNIKSLYFMFLLFALSASYGFAQQKNKQSLKLVHYRDNVKGPLTSKEKGLLEEVFADKLQDYILTKPQRVKDYKHLLRNRIEIKELPDLIPNHKKYKLLSTVGLFNNYNGNLKFDTTYNPDTFNPLKYNLQFFGRGSSIYRIDNTNYFIIIKSQHY